MQGQTLRLVPGGSLAGVAEASLGEALAALSFVEGMTLVLERSPLPGCGDDHVTAINLTRPMSHPPSQSVVIEARMKAEARYKEEVPLVKICHYIGGPCAMNEVSHCVVTGGHGCGWTVVTSLQEAIEIAITRTCTRVVEAQGAVRGGQSVRLIGLQARPEPASSESTVPVMVLPSVRW